MLVASDRSLRGLAPWRRGVNHSASGPNAGGWTQEETPGRLVTYHYDPAGRRDQLTVGSGASAAAYSYGYDDANRLRTVGRSAPLPAVQATIDYDDAGRRSKLRLPNQVEQNYTFDPGSRLTQILYKRGIATLGDLNYEYDADGRRTAVWGSFARTGLPAAFTSRTYNTLNQLTAQGNQVFSYDLNGNLTNDGPNTYGWNARNELVSITPKKNTPGPTASFSYDPFGRRHTKTVAGTQTGFQWDGANVARELSGSAVGADLMDGLGPDELFERKGSAGTSDYLTDPLGSTLALTDTLGATQSSYTYDPFGVASASPASSNPYQYTGRENDNTGLTYLRNRYYSPGLQRFISEDPIAFAGGDPNLYAYVYGNPVDLVDPAGLKAWSGSDHIPASFGTHPNDQVAWLRPNTDPRCIYAPGASAYNSYPPAGCGSRKSCAVAGLSGKILAGGQFALEADGDPGVMPTGGGGVGFTGGLFGSAGKGKVRSGTAGSFGSRQGDCSASRSAIEISGPRASACLIKCVNAGDGGPEWGLGIDFTLIDVNVSPADLLG